MLHSMLRRREIRQNLLLAAFWPVFGLCFYALEWLVPGRQYHVMYHPIDDRIPFCELFLIPYLFWFAFLVGMHLYLLLYDVNGFRRFMGFLIVTFSITMVIYLLFPTCQELRPTEFARDNAFTRFLAFFYRFDTNTNVCPSMHVIGSLAVGFAAAHTDALKAWKGVFRLCAVLICASTVFLKQHSVVDVLLALPLCAIGHLFFYSKTDAAASV